jgi:pimeloyl-ACP methyl ester carboxylesterase
MSALEPEPGMTALASLAMPAGRANNFWYVSNSSDTAVVFVHGVFSSSRSCWLFEDVARAQKVFWPDLVRGDARLGNPSIFLAGYHTNLESGDYSLTECATELRDALRLRDVDQARAPYDYRRLVFVCHSTGGIVMRYLINRYKGDFKGKDVGLALMASPSLGSEWADVFALAAKYYNQGLGRQLSWDDSALQDLHWQFSELVENRHKEMPGLFGREAAEHHMIGRRRIPKFLRWLFPPRNTVVNKVSAGQYFGQVRPIPGTDHFSIVKPDGLDHPSHTFLVGFMADFASGDRAGAPTMLVPRESVMATDRVVQPPVGATTILSGGRPPALDLKDWPESESETVHFFFADSGFDPKSETAVVVCVVVDDVKTLEQPIRTLLAQPARTSQGTRRAQLRHPEQTA